MSLWALIGWIGNACFFSRFLVQWLQSERAGKTLAPRAFWWLSLTGTTLLFAYTFHRGEPVLLAGFAVNAVLYARNLQLAYGFAIGPQLGNRLLVSAAALALAVLIFAGMTRFEESNDSSVAWLTAGIVGQVVWCSRFVLQWIASERKRASHFPRAFWWVSLTGNMLLLAYAIHLGDPVWIAGLSLGPFVQIRNLILSSKRSAVIAPARRAPSAPREALGPARPSP